jgi:hypothetical protein
MRPSSGAILTGELLVIPGLAAELHAYSTADGTPAGDYEMRGAENEELQFAARPHLTADDTLILLTKNGLVRAVAGAPPPPVSTP